MNETRGVAAIILAAGGSSRLGKSKQLLSFRGKTLIRHVTDVATEANCSPVIVVAGNGADQIRRELTDTSAVVVANASWQSGVGSSVSCGVRWLIGNNEGIRAAVLLVCDQPSVDQDVINRLIELYQLTRKPIIASIYNATIGVPALFEKSFFPDLMKLNGDEGAKKIILAHRDRVAEFEFPQGAFDIDTLADVAKLPAS